MLLVEASEIEVVSLDKVRLFHLIPPSGAIVRCCHTWAVRLCLQRYRAGETVLAQQKGVA